MLAARIARSAAGAGRARGFASVVENAGVRVAAAPHDGPTASVTLLVKAGARFENIAGAAHALKNFAFKSTAKRSGLGAVREAELYGGVLSTALSREHLAVTAEFLKGDEAFFVDLLTSFATTSKFTRYEFEESVLPTVAAESAAATTDAGVHALELAHALAFRTGLGASLFAPEHATHLTAKDVAQFASTVLAKDNLAFLGTGLAQDALARLVEAGLASAPASASAPTDAAKYFGGETRVAGHGGAPTVFIGFGAAGQSVKSAELAALAAHLSTAPAVKWAQGTSALAQKLPAGSAVTPVLLPYADAALFGLLVQGASPGVVAEAGRAAVQALKDAAGSFHKDAAAVAVKKAKYAAASALETRDGLVGVLGARVLQGADATVEGVLGALDGVEASAISSAASGLLKSKATYVVVGDVNALPHADELGL